MQLDPLKRRAFITLLGGAAAWPLAAHAQQPDRMRLIGVLIAAIEGDPFGQSRVVAFRDALANLGWTERNLRMEVRWGSNPALIERYAAELVALGAEVLVAESTAALQALRRQSNAVPIVFLGVADPRALMTRLRWA
jgi:putative ABC transport system substrate-binding protein